MDIRIIGQVQEFFPPWHPLTQSDHEAAEQKLDKLRESRDDLLEADGRYQRVQEMKEAVRSRRNRAKNLLDDKVSSVNSLFYTGADTRSIQKSAWQTRWASVSAHTGEKLGRVRAKIETPKRTLELRDRRLFTRDRARSEA